MTLRHRGRCGRRRRHSCLLGALATMVLTGMTIGCGALARADDAPDTPAPQAAAPDREPLGPGTHVLKIRAAGHAWSAVLHVPDRYNGETDWPLVIGLHGAGGDGRGFLERNGWRKLADREGFLVVAPDGLPALPRRPASFRQNPRLWNTGQLNPGSPRSRIDDIAFFRALLAETARRVRVAEGRVYLTGHSNGAGMTFRLAQELGKELAAIAPVASLCWQAEPRLEQPLPTLYIYGLEDPLVPYEGGESRLIWGGARQTPPVEETLRKWAAALGCTAERRTISTDNGVRTLAYDNCRGGTPFRVILIEGHGHEWPGGQAIRLLREQLGPSRNVVNATEVIWEFFRTGGRR